MMCLATVEGDAFSLTLSTSRERDEKIFSAELSHICTHM